MEIHKIYNKPQKNHINNNINFFGKEDENIKLSSEIKKAFLSKDYSAQNAYFRDLVDNTGLVLRSCGNDEYIKSTQILLDNIKHDKYGNNETFENQIRLLCAFVKPSSHIKEYVNPDTFYSNFRDFMCNDNYIVAKINQIYEPIGGKEKI